MIPKSLQADIRQQLHKGHQGIGKTRALARESVYWIGINKDIEETCKLFSICQEFQELNKRESLMPHDIPSRPWQFITDLFDIGNRKFVLTVDRYSRYPLVEELSPTASSKTITGIIQIYCAMFGRPDEIMSDNGPQYSGESFKRFTNDWNIKHVTSSPNYPRSNGFIERHVKHIKSALKKTIRSGEDWQMKLLNLQVPSHM